MKGRLRKGGDIEVIIIVILEKESEDMEWMGSSKEKGGNVEKMCSKLIKMHTFFHGDSKCNKNQSVIYTHMYTHTHAHTHIMYKTYTKAASSSVQFISSNSSCLMIFYKKEHKSRLVGDR